MHLVEQAQAALSLARAAARGDGRREADLGERRAVTVHNFEKFDGLGPAQGNLARRDRRIEAEGALAPAEQRVLDRVEHG